MGGGSKGQHFIFQNIVLLHIKLKGMIHAATFYQQFHPLYHRGGVNRSKFTLKEHGHVACKIKGIHKWSNMVANILPAEPPPPPPNHWGEVERSKFNFFRTWSHYISNQKESRMQQNGSKCFACRPLPPPYSRPLGEVLRSKFIF